MRRRWEEPNRAVDQNCIVGGECRAAGIKPAATGSHCLVLPVRQSYERLPSLLHIADGSLEGEPELLSGFEHIKAVSIDAGHLRRIAPTIVPQRITMVIVHVLNDPRFLHCGKWVFRHEFTGFYPVDLAKSRDESNAHEFQPEKREVMRLIILRADGKYRKYRSRACISPSPIGRALAMQVTRPCACTSSEPPLFSRTVSDSCNGPRLKYLD